MANVPFIPVEKSRLYDDVFELTSITPARNHQNLVSLNYIAGYIAYEFNKLKCRVEWQKYQAGGKEYKNILATFGDVSKERIVVGAHYDVCGEGPGADDNASAVAGLLEIGRLLNQLGPTLNCGVELVAYTLEEPPYFATSHMGSAVHAHSLATAKAKVKAMICLEMIGYFSDEPYSQHFPFGPMKYFYPSTGNFITVVGKLSQRSFLQRFAKFMRQASNIDVQVFAAPAIMPAIGLSDHRNYWAQGYQAIMINDTSFFRNPHYHRKSDTIQTLNFEKMAEVIKGVYWAIVNL